MWGTSNRIQVAPGHGLVLEALNCGTQVSGSTSRDFLSDVMLNVSYLQPQHEGLKHWICEAITSVKTIFYTVCIGYNKLALSTIFAGLDTLKLFFNHQLVRY
jgi:hypothetical protein